MSHFIVNLNINTIYQQKILDFKNTGPQIIYLPFTHIAYKMNVPNLFFVLFLCS